MESVTSILSVIAQDYGPDPDRIAVAAERGTRAHNACIAHSLGFYQIPDDDIIGYFHSFKGWFDEKVDLVVIKPEVELTDHKWHFCGHPDFPWLKLKDETDVIIDLKTPTQHRKIWDLQVGGAYWHLVRFHTGLLTIKPGCLMLDPDGGTARMVWIKNPEECFSVFLGILNAKRFLQNGGK